MGSPPHLGSPAGLTGLDQYFSRRFQHHTQRFKETGAALYAIAKKVYRAQKMKFKLYNGEGERVLFRHHHNLNREMKSNVKQLKDLLKHITLPPLLSTVGALKH